MKKTLLILLTVFGCGLMSFAHDHDTELGQKFVFDFESVNQQKTNLRKAGGFSVELPVEGEYHTFLLKENALSGSSETIKTYDGKTASGTYKIKLSVFSDRIEGIISAPSGYYVFEPVDIEDGIYRIYNMSEVPRENLQCGVEGHDHSEAVQESEPKLKGTKADVFPFGLNMRVFKMAAAATGEMTTLYGGSKPAAIAQIVSIINATNLIYEQELAMSFLLIDKTTNGTIIWDNAATDPFTPDLSFPNVDRSQAGFNDMNNSGAAVYSGVLPYNEYHVGHTFHAKASISGYSISGQAGPTPCSDTGKSRGWTEWTMGSPLGAIVNVFAHEVGHQFAAWHTYNATGGSSGSPTFCTSGWNSSHAVEPGGGSTLMGYGTNCSVPVDQTLTGDNNLSYFHYKSIEAIQNFLSSAGCYTTVATENTPPTAYAGVDITIPKNTPFWLNGIASDADDDLLIYTWEQNDVAKSADQGALGTIHATGGTSAVNSLYAPLFRSEKSMSTDRTFPKLNFILNNQNQPGNNEGEALPIVARAMKFRFTVKDGNAGVASDEITVNVANVGPLTVNSPNGSETLNANSSTNITWAVNSTNTLSPNVDILLSVDGGLTFPYLLASDTPNDGSQPVTIPNVPGTTQARIKVVAVLNENANFFDISNANFTINNALCQSYGSIPCFAGDVSAKEGNSLLNLNLSAASPIQIQNSLAMTITGSQSGRVILRESNVGNNCKDFGGLYGVYTGPIRKFRVTKSGSYTLMKNESCALTLFNTPVTGPAAASCTGFMNSTAYWAGSGTSAYFHENTMTVSLNAYTDYYLYVFAFGTISSTLNVAITGPGDAYTESTAPSGTGYTYIAVRKSDNMIKAVHSSANFTSLAAGDYRIYGISYPSTSVVTGFVDKTLSTVQGSDCVVTSLIYVNMNVIDVSTGLSEQNSVGNQITLYPSPVEDFVYIKSDIRIVKAEIINYLGQIIAVKDIQGTEISLKNLLSGVYIVKMYDEFGKAYSTKLVKK